MYTTLIQTLELYKLIGNAPKDLIIADCRYDLKNPDKGGLEYLDSHIPGAVYVSLDKDLSDHRIRSKGRHPLPTPASLQTLFSRLGIHKNSQVVVYDHSDGSFAARLWWLLRYMNHTAVAVLDGGLANWTRLDLPIRHGTETRESAKFTGVPNPAFLVETESVLRVPLLIDSRAPERYSGKVELIDPVAGHIPGAKNRFYKENVDEEGLFLKAEALHLQFSKFFESTDPSKVAFYCGSGVTACQNILAAVHAGFPQSRLYAGSWSEWCSDSRRKVQKNK